MSNINKVITINIQLIIVINIFLSLLKSGFYKEKNRKIKEYQQTCQISIIRNSKL